MKKKVLIALYILLPILILAMAAMITLQFTCFQLHGEVEGDVGTALGFVFTILFNIIPSFVMAALGALLILLTILLLCVKKKLGVVITTLIVLILLLPFTGFCTFLDISALYMFIEVPIMAGLVVLLILTDFVLCCVLIHQHGREKKRKKLEQKQREETQLDDGQTDEFHF